MVTRLSRHKNPTQPPFRHGDHDRHVETEAGLSIMARCYDNHSALLMHITSSGLGYSTQPPFRHGDHDHHDEMEAGLDFYAGTIA